LVATREAFSYPSVITTITARSASTSSARETRRSMASKISRG
jgi:hypothetical protein